MISSAIWNKQAQVNFSKTNKIALTLQAAAIWGLWKIYKCLFIPNCTRKIMWLFINNIYEKILRWLSRRNAHVSHNQRKIAPSRACAWFENKRFHWPSVSFSFATFLSINLISTFCTQFQLSALFEINNIDMLSVNQCGEIFACVLLDAEFPCFTSQTRRHYSFFGN